MSQKQPRDNNEDKAGRLPLMYLEVMKFTDNDLHYINVDHGDRIIESRDKDNTIDDLFGFGDRFLFSPENGKVKAFFEKKTEKWTINPDILEELTNKLFSVV